MANGGAVAPRTSTVMNQDLGSDDQNSASESQNSSSENQSSGSESQSSGLESMNSNSGNQDSSSDIQDSGSGVISRILMVNLATSQTTDLLPNSPVSFKESDFSRGFNVEVVVPGGASYVEFRWEGNYKREGTSPYLLAGNMGAKYGRWRNYPRGYNFTLTVDAYVSGTKHSKSVQLRID